MQHAGARASREDEHDRGSSPGSRHLRLVGEQDRVEARASHDRYAPVYAENGRRTVKITGQPLPPRRRPSPTRSQLQARPDRIALWAFLLGMFLVFMAVATANAAPLQ